MRNTNGHGPESNVEESTLMSSIPHQIGSRRHKGPPLRKWGRQGLGWWPSLTQIWKKPQGADYKFYSFLLSMKPNRKTEILSMGTRPWVASQVRFGRNQQKVRFFIKWQQSVKQYVTSGFGYHGRTRWGKTKTKSLVLSTSFGLPVFEPVSLSKMRIANGMDLMIMVTF